MTLLLLAGIYKVFDPSKAGYFPVCPFYGITGLLCPGCGSQRAIHLLLNFDITGAFRQNALLIPAIPYVITGMIFDLMKTSDERFCRLRKLLYGKKAIYIILSIILIYWILRNILR